MLTDLILYSKVYPPKSTGEGLVARTSLFDILDTGLKKKLTYISSPSGFGKTTLLTDWLNKTQKNSAWLTLGEQENNAKLFFKYLVISIQQNINPNFGQQALKETENNYFDLGKFITLFLNDFIFFPNDYVIVLDNYQVIVEPEITQTIGFIIKNLPNNVHFYISSKTKDDFINYSRLRAENNLAEIGTEELKFQLAELQEYYEHKNQIITKEKLELIHQKTEGWILGIHLASLFIKENDFSEGINNKFIIDYIFDEVLENTKPEILAFLVKTSILSSFNYDLANLINGIDNSYEIINYLNKNNLFITSLDKEGEYYRFYNLFSEILLRKLRLSYPTKLEKELSLVSFDIIVFYG